MSVLYGRQPVMEALKAKSGRVQKVLLADGVQGPFIERLKEEAQVRGIPFQWVPRRQLDRLVKGNHQGVVAQVNPLAYQDLEQVVIPAALDQNPVLIALDEIQDPQNFGAILRSAAFFGVKGVITPRWRSAPLSDAVLRVASGAAEHVPVIQVRNLAETIEEMKGRGFAVLGADVSGVPAWELDEQRPTLLVIGGEGKGLRRLVKEHCDRLVGIPPHGAIGSLNAATACALLLYELRRPGVGAPTPGE